MLVIGSFLFLPRLPFLNQVKVLLNTGFFFLSNIWIVGNFRAKRRHLYYTGATHFKFLLENLKRQKFKIIINTFESGD